MLILTEPEEDRVQAVHGGHGQVHVAPAQHLDYLLTAAALPKGWRLWRHRRTGSSGGGRGAGKGQLPLFPRGRERDVTTGPARLSGGGGEGQEGAQLTGRPGR